MTLLMNQAKLFCSSILKSTIGRFGNRCKSLEEKYSIANITVYLIFLLSCIVCYLIDDLKRALLPSFRDTPIYLAFQTPTYIYFALIVNVAIYLPTLLDILLDLKSYRDMTFQDDVDIGEEHDSLLERAFMAVINISFASVLLILRNDKDVAFYVLWFHAPQFVGNLGVVLILCRKLVPKYFSAMNILCAQFFFGLGISIAFSMFGESSGGSWLNILVAISLILTWYFLLIRISLPWLRDLWSRGVLFGKESVTIRESCALWYFVSTILIIIIAPGVTFAGKHFDLASTDIYDVCLVLFSFCLFGIILNTVPGRLARNAVDRERKKALANKQALVRYIGHEVRSPLNVIASGLKILQADISKLQLLEEEKAVLMDTVVSMQQESEDLLKTMNDLLQLENMESSAFSVEEKVVPCSDLLKMAENCSVSAREKGINFSVRSQIGQQPVEMTAAMPLREGEPRDIERGGSEDIKEPDPAAAALSVCIDEQKMGQVVRNLITNAIKFTPAEKSITVTLCEAIPADLTEEGSLVNEEKITVTKKKKKKRRVPSSDMHSGHVVFEVAAEMARENWSKMSLEFKQFDVNDLQGGGGLWLGMWISQEIVKLHGSRIRFHSDGEGGGRGTRVFFILPCYKKNTTTNSTNITTGHGQHMSLPAPPPPLTPLFWHRPAQVGPELEPDGPRNDKDCLDVKFSGIARRALSRPGQCKVLVVDDSQMCNKVVMKVLKRIPIDCPDIAGVVELFSGLQGMRRSFGGRSNAYRQQVSEAALTNTTAAVYNFVEADDGSTAVQMVQEASLEGDPFDIVFMDNIMIRMNGPAAAQLMRSAGFTGLIVGVTGNVMAHDVAHYIASGADCVLHKPVNAEELKQILRRLY